ncbi:hypothetical protein [Candidatus Methanarcanum hacksteinii]|uniref:hypothetical protein n=1 Tax=Candidatus Methanarcanum hacksteinii TaxID=2911857 RepID=UPI0037DCA071
MQKKVIAAMVALMMVATGIVILEMTQESDASATDGLATYNFFFAKQGDTSWTTHQGSGYNAFIALKAVLDNEETGYTANENYTATVDNYTTINSSYGQFTSIDGLIGSTYSVFMYSKVTESWIPGPTTALGFYQAYSDYDANLRTANIIIYDGVITTAQAIGIALPSGNNLASIYDVTTTNAFKVTFHISIANVTARPTSVSEADWNYAVVHQGTYYGYGSNCYLALQNAISSAYGNNSMYNTSNGGINVSSYGYVSSMMGVKEANTSTETQSIWDYWSIYIGSSIAQDGSNYSLFTGGFLTPLSGLGSQYECSELCYQFVHSVYP